MQEFSIFPHFTHIKKKEAEIPPLCFSIEINP